MRSALILAIASTVAAQYFPGQPSCAIPCLSSAITSAGCRPTDVACQCGPTQAAIGAAAAGCLLSNCNLSEVQQAQSAGNAVCSSFSNGQLSSIPASTTGSGAASATSTRSASITSAPSSTSAASHSGSSSGSSHSSGASSSSGSSTRGSTSGTGSVSTATVLTTNSQGLPTTVVSTTARPAAGATQGVMIGGAIVAGVIGVVAAL